MAYTTEPSVKIKNATQLASGVMRFRLWHLCLSICLFSICFSLSASAAAQNNLTPIIPARHVQIGKIPLQPIDTVNPNWEARPIDIIILGDGYLQNEQNLFTQDVEKWYEEFTRVTPYNYFAGAFRVRGYFVPSDSRSNPERQSFYQLSAKQRMNANGKPSGYIMETQLGPETISRIDELLLSIKESQHSDFMRDGKPNTVLVMLVKPDQPSAVVSGFTATINTRFGQLRMAVAEAHIHEFTHAFASLKDEYINTADSHANAGARSNMLKSENDFWSKNNFSYSADKAELPWRHIAPGSDGNPDALSVIGLPWIGGIAEFGVWHSEPYCLMNGSHQNWDLLHERRGVGLRSPYFCFWCEELVTARIAALTGLLGNDLNDPNLWAKWVKLRPSYYKAFRVEERMDARNNEYTKLELFKSPLIQKDVPEQDRLSQTSPQRLPNVLEGEDLKILQETGGKHGIQAMDGFKGFWSGASQLWWADSKVGDQITFALNVPSNGHYRLEAQFTKAPDYGIIQFSIDGNKLGEPQDLYSPGVIASGEINIGTENLIAGAHRLTIEIAGANDKAIKRYMVGLDYLRLVPVNK